MAWQLKKMFFLLMIMMSCCVTVFEVRRRSQNSFKHQDRQTIPKIIHQIWNDDIIPDDLAEYIRGFIKNQPPPKWKYYFWTKETGLRFIKDKYPILYKKAYAASDLMRADILRCLVIHQYGGVYFDLDTVSVKPLDSFVEKHECSLAQEPGENYFYYKDIDFLLSNSALLCVANHPFYSDIVHNFLFLYVKYCSAALICTGPPVLTKHFLEFSNRSNFKDRTPDIQPSEVFQDWYDPTQGGILNENCLMNKTILPHQVKICENWIMRGKDTRKLSPRALTYHTWYHGVNRQVVTTNKQYHIKTLVPHAMMYGVDFN